MSEGELGIPDSLVVRGVGQSPPDGWWYDFNAKALSKGEEFAISLHVGAGGWILGPTTDFEKGPKGKVAQVYRPILDPKINPFTTYSAS